MHHRFSRSSLPKAVDDLQIRPALVWLPLASDDLRLRQHVRHAGGPIEERRVRDPDGVRVADGLF